MKSLFYPRHGRFPGKIPPDHHAVLVAHCWNKAQVLSSNQLHHQHQQFLNNIRPLTGIILRDPSLNERPSKRSNKRSRVQYRRYSQYRNKQSVLDYRNVEQIKHLYALVSTLSCKHQWILDVQFHPNVIGNLYLQHI